MIIQKHHRRYDEPLYCTAMHHTLFSASIMLVKTPSADSPQFLAIRRPERIPNFPLPLRCLGIQVCLDIPS